MRLEEGDGRSARMARSDFETLFADQMTGINRNNGRLRVSLSFATKRQFRSNFAMRFATAKLMLLCCEVAHVCQNHFRNCEIPCGIGLLVRIRLFLFAMRFTAAKWVLMCCEVALVCQTRLRNCENSRRDFQSVAEWFGNKMLIDRKSVV